MTVRTDIWNQQGGSATGGGFRLVNSIRATALRWMVSLPGPTGLCSPVIGPDGTIYIGTTNGRLLAVPPDHYTKWNSDIAGSAYAVETPAVADDGTIYCLCRSQAIVHDHRTPRTVGLPSFLVAVRPDGTVAWRVPIRALPDMFGTVNCEIYGAPRVISGPRGTARIVFVVRYTLMVEYPQLGSGSQGPMFVRVLVIMDEQGRTHLFNRYEQELLFIEAGGGGGLPGGATLEDPPYGGLPKGASAYTDTPAVFGSFPARERWTIVAPGKRGLYTFRWSEQEDALAQSPTRFGPADPAAPAAFANGLLTGISGGGAEFFDAETFAQHVPGRKLLGGPSTVAGGLRQMYFLTRYGTLVAMDSNGKVWKNRNVSYGSVAMPALSANHVHIATAGGVHTFSLDLQQEIGFVTLAGTSSGYSSPAIGPNGEVYVAGGSYRPSPAANSSLYALFDATPRGGRRGPRGNAASRAVTPARSRQRTKRTKSR